GPARDPREHRGERRGTLRCRAAHFVVQWPQPGILCRATGRVWMCRGRRDLWHWRPARSLTVVVARACREVPPPAHRRATAQPQRTLDCPAARTSILQAHRNRGETVSRQTSRMLPLGTPAPPFALPDTVTGRTVSIGDFSASPALLVAFISNHCPFVKHILDGFVTVARDLGAQGLAVVAICANDAKAYPEDAPPQMARIATAKAFSFSYLYDESQQVARAYHAVCTPDLFLFDRDRRLAYRGRFDGSTPGNG